MRSEEIAPRIRAESELDVRRKHILEQVVGTEKICEKSRKADADLSKKFQQLAMHLERGSSRQLLQTANAAAKNPLRTRNRRLRESEAKRETEVFMMTPQPEATWESDGMQSGMTPG